MIATPPRIDRETVIRLWLSQQGLATSRGARPLTKRALADHLTVTGGLQLDSINVVARAHYLTVWSRFGPYEPARLDNWVYRHRIGYEYWGHEASILPMSHLPIGLRRMRSFPPQQWTRQSWWKGYVTSTASKRRVLRRLRTQGPLEIADFDRQPQESDAQPSHVWAMPLPKEDRRSLRLLWHSGRIAVTTRRHFRRVFDLAERVYPRVAPASTRALEDSWLLGGLSGNGIASEQDLVGYITGPHLSASSRRRVIERNLKSGRVVEVRVPDSAGRYFALPEHLDALKELPEPAGTTLVCPFDSLLWQRRRAEELLGFRYRVEIYTPPARRVFGYYALPILHRGALVGCLDPKLHRDRQELEVRAIRLQPGVRRSTPLNRGIRDSLQSLAQFVGARAVRLPRGWSRLG